MGCVCSICGRQLEEHATVFQLETEWMRDEVLCKGCTDLIKRLKTLSREGSGAYDAVRQSLVAILERERYTKKGGAYCVKLIKRYDSVFEERAADDRKAEALPAPIIAVVQPEPQAVLCPSCGAENEVDSVFCETCATRIKAISYCRFCGGQMSPITGCCEACGRSRNGTDQKQQNGLAAARSAVTEIAASVSTAIQSVGKEEPAEQGTGAIKGTGWPLWAVAAVSAMLGLMLIGKMVSIPAVGLFTSGSDSYSLFQAAEFCKDLAEITHNDSIASAGILLTMMAVTAEILFAFTIIFGILHRRTTFALLKASCITSVCLTVFMLFEISMVNKGIESGVNELFSFEASISALEPTALLIISLIISGFVGFFFANWLRKRFDDMNGIVVPVITAGS